jgi:hypothetical protein
LNEITNEKEEDKCFICFEKEGIIKIDNICNCIEKACLKCLITQCEVKVDRIIFECKICRKSNYIFYTILQSRI